jgi:Mg2+/Co2+ transporter CorC
MNYWRNAIGARAHGNGCGQYGGIWDCHVEISSNRRRDPENDQSEEAPYVQIGEGEYIFQGRVEIKNFNEVMGSQLPMEETETLGGFVYEQIGRVPTSGESLQVGDINLTIEQVTGRRIRKVRAKRLTENAQETREDEDKADK